MVRHKGQRTNKQREAAFPCAIDIPIGGDGLGQNLNRIHEAARACLGATDVWGHCTRLTDGTPERWCRIGAALPGDADQLAALFASLGARRVR